MPGVKASNCQLKRGLFRCRAKAVGSCQYCGRHFCDRHTELIEELQEVCSREYCVAKRQDLVKHLAYKDDVLGRNADGACGIDGCEQEMQSQCGRCRGRFCVAHVQVDQETVMDNWARERRLATLCEHCAVRRPIWRRQ